MSSASWRDPESTVTAGNDRDGRGRPPDRDLAGTSLGRPEESILCPQAPGLAVGAASALPWGQIKDQSPLCDAVPTRSTGPVFVAEEGSWMPVPAPVPRAALADLRRSSVLIISSAGLLSGRV